MQAKIELQSVGKDFPSQSGAMRAVEGIDLAIEDQKFLAVVGPSGCGKSTILNMIAGLFQPSKGRVIYDGAPVIEPNQKVGYMTQKDTLLPWRNVEDNVGIALELRCRSISSRERRSRTQDLIKLVGLSGFEKHFPAQLSGGMRKRAALARMMIYEPETLLLDEPFGALDAQLKIIMQQELDRLTQLRRMTVVFVTHDLGEAIALADRVAVFTSRPGRIRAVRDIDLPRPRDVQEIRLTPEFAAIYEELWRELKDEVARSSDA